MMVSDKQPVIGVVIAERKRRVTEGCARPQLRLLILIVRFSGLILTLLDSEGAFMSVAAPLAT